MGQAAELVRDLAAVGRRRVVLKRVRVHGVEPDALGRGVLAKRRGIVGIVPRNVQAHRSVGAGERVQRGDVVDLLFGRPGFATAREAAEAGRPGPDRPARRGHREGGDLTDDPVGIHADSLHPFGGGGQIPLVANRSALVLVGDSGSVDLQHRFPPRHEDGLGRRSPSIPPSTVRHEPVVKDDDGEAR